MFTMTEAAAGLLERMLEESDAPDGVAVRFVFEGEDLKSRIDTIQPGDQVFAHDGRKVLIVDQGVSKALSKSVLDVEQTQKGAALVLMH